MTNHYYGVQYTPEGSLFCDNYFVIRYFSCKCKPVRVPTHVAHFLVFKFKYLIAGSLRPDRPQHQETELPKAQHYTSAAHADVDDDEALGIDGWLLTLFTNQVQDE